MKTLLRLALCAALLATAQAQPAYMNYQGKLTDNNGQPLPGSGTNLLEFNIYTAATGGSPVWGPFLCDGLVATGHTARTIVSSGRFNVILGPTDTTSRPIQAVFTNSTLFLDIKVNGPSISPRQQFLSAPYAFTALNSLSSLTVTDPNVAYRNTPNTFTGNQTVNGSVTASVNVTAGGNIAATGNVTAGGRGVAVGEENLRIVRGSVDINGVTQAGSGYTPQSLGGGFYKITFASPFGSIPTVTVSGRTSRAISLSVDPVTTTNFTVSFHIAQTGDQLSAFGFIAIGPR